MADRETRAFINGGIVVALAIGVGMFWYARGTNASNEDDGPGPNMIIEVAGVANGTVVIDLDPMIAPKHVAQIKALAEEGAYDGSSFTA